MNDWSLVTVIEELPSPWPVWQPITLIRQPISGNRYLEIATDYSARLTVSIRESDSTLVSTAQSPKLICRRGKCRIILVVCYADSDRRIDLRVNGNDPSSVGRRLEVDADDSATMPVINDESGLVSARARRAERLKDRRKSGLTEEQESRRWDDMKREQRLLESALRRLKAGNDDNVVTVSAHLRKLVGIGGGNELLYDCASFRDLEIPIFMRPPDPSDLWTPEHLPGKKFWHCAEPFALEPTGFQIFRTDLAVWQSGRAGSIGDETLTNIKFLHHIADKIGAHADVQRDLVQSLEEFRFMNETRLSTYLIGLADATLRIIERDFDIAADISLTG